MVMMVVLVMVMMVTVVVVPVSPRGVLSHVAVGEGKAGRAISATSEMVV